MVLKTEVQNIGTNTFLGNFEVVAKVESLKTSPLDWAPFSPVASWGAGLEALCLLEELLLFSGGDHERSEIGM